MTVIPGPLCVY